MLATPTKTKSVNLFLVLLPNLQVNEMTKMKLRAAVIKVTFALIAGSLSAVGLAGQRAIAANDIHVTPIASDGADRVGVNRVASDGADHVGANHVASDGADHVGANRVASDGADHVGANRVASDGADHVGANRVASIGMYDTPYSLESSPYFCGPCR